MRAPIILIPLALEWLLIVTALTPSTFFGKFSRRPNLGIFLWFSSALSGLAAIVLVFGTALWALFELVSDAALGRSLAVELASNLGIWALLALGGVVLSLINQRAEPVLSAAKAIKPNLVTATVLLKRFQAVSVYSLELPLPVIFTAKVNSKTGIVLSTKTLEVLSEPELEAALWHELGHIRGRHVALKSLARAIALITPRIVASKYLVQETDRLMELAADKFASRTTDREQLDSARSKFLE